MSDVGRDSVNEIAALRIAKIGDSTGVVLSDQLLARLKLKEGDTLYVVEEPDGNWRLSRFDADHVRTIEIADRMMLKYRDVLAALAK